jgi:GPH family glycoside/pentoside/hexuronide:cation symporter
MSPAASDAERAATPGSTPAADRIPFAHKVAYGMGALINNLLAAAIGGMTIILNLGFGMNPALVGLLGAIPRFVDAVIDPVMGYLSDQTVSRWGRRRPYIFGGALLSGVLFIALWQMPAGRSESFYFTWFLVGSVLFYVAYTVFAAPWVALGYELTPDYHERTRLMGVQNFIGQVAYLVSPWFLWVMNRTAWFPTPREGAAGLAIAIGVTAMVVGIIPAVVLRERYAAAAVPAATAATPEGLGALLGRHAREFASGFAVTLQSRPFLVLCAVTFLVFNGFITVSAFQSYALIYYVFGGDQGRGAEFAGYVGSLSAASSFAAISLVAWLGTRLGKHRALLVSTGLSVAGYLLKWVCFDPAHPWWSLVPAPLMAFGLGGLFTLMPAMIADVVDVDELATRERREGMYSSIYWWVVKLGMAAALAGGGYLLNATGFDVAKGGAQGAGTILALRLADILVPSVASLVAMALLWRYPITEARAVAVRRELEARRAAATPPSGASPSGASPSGLPATVSP